MKLTAIVSLALTIAFALLYACFSADLFSALAITLFTVFYHFSMRLLVGEIYDRLLNNRVDYTRNWFKPHKFEQKIYEKLRVKHWKRYFPTYDPDTFNPQNHSWSEIASATCQSELVHETIVCLSFLPIIFSAWFGAVAVFAITSFLAALFDMAFVVIQRYNRPRIMKLLRNLHK